MLLREGHLQPGCVPGSRGSGRSSFKKMLEMIVSVVRDCRSTTQQDISA